MSSATGNRQPATGMRRRQGYGRNAGHKTNGETYMARAPQYYNSKDDMAKDLFYILNVNSLEFATKRAVLEHITAALPEWDGKFDRFPSDADKRGIDTKRVTVSDHYNYTRVPDGCRFWSARALAHWVDDNRDEGDYRFEHLVPRNVRSFVLDREAESQVPFSNVAHTRQFLECVSIAAVILADEDLLLDQRSFPGDLAAPDVDPWGRYRVANQIDPGFIVYVLSKGTPAF
jgi:hypothetical protein